MKFFALVFVILSVSAAVLADELRSISLEWEVIPDARYYDVEVHSLRDNKLIRTQSVQTASWSGQLDFGDYTLRVRGRDKRKVSGDWSEPQNFHVGLETPAMTSPKVHEKFSSASDDEKEVLFKWSAVKGATSYLLEVESKDGKFSKQETTNDKEYSIKLPVAAEYTWKISAIGSHDLVSDEKAQADFSVWGAKIAKPTILEPKNAFVRQLEWERPTYAENFDYVIFKYDDKQKKWVLQEKSQTANQTAAFAQKFAGGKYKIAMRANAPFRPSSNVAERSFDVINGSRSPAAEEVATVRESIDHTTGWFGEASYLMTSLSYSGTNSDSVGVPANLSFNGALGGTGRFGLGYLAPTSPWGFLSIADYSGILINNSVVNFSSLEANAIYRTDIGDRSEIRQQMGLFYKQLPVFIAIANTQNGSTAEQATMLGPHYGVEYWQAITPKFGYQINAHGYVNAISLGTPNGNSLSPGLSYQLGFLGSYRLTRRMTGLAGYAYRIDSVSYQATDGATNTSTLTGNYLNLLLEWEL